MSDKEEIRELGDKLSKAMKLPKNMRICDSMAEAFVNCERKAKEIDKKITKD